jgi:hypothetical protein
MLLAAAGLLLTASCGRPPAAQAVIVLRPVPGLAAAREAALLGEQAALLRSRGFLEEVVALLPEPLRRELDADDLGTLLTVVADPNDATLHLGVAKTPSAEAILGRDLAAYLHRASGSREFSASVTGTATLR